MKLVRVGYLFGWGRVVLAVAGAVYLQSGFVAAQNLICENGYIPPLVDLDFPLYPQQLNTSIVILTDQYSPVGVNSVTVVRDGNNNDVFNFNIFSGGVVSPNYSQTVFSSGPDSSGSSPKIYATTIGTYVFSGDNFPLSAWPDDPDWQAPPVMDSLAFNLDEALGWVATPLNSRQFTVESDYYYDDWAWISWLGYEGPYTQNPSQPQPTANKVTFDFRGGVQQKPNPPFHGPCSCNCSKNPPTSSPPQLAGGMAVASLDRFQAGIAITDTPISYQPQVGLGMAFTVAYHQRQTNQPAAFNFSNLGPQWNGSWISYISGGPTGGQTDAVYHAPDGSQYTYEDYQQTPAQGLGAAVVNEGTFLKSEAWTHATLHYLQNPERYERWLPDGTTEVYAQPAGTISTTRLFFLTLVSDPQGNTTTLTYDPVAAANGEAVLKSVTDPQGGQLVFSYDTANPLLITKVTRSTDGLSARFEYANGQLSSMTDTSGITSSFGYASGTAFVSSMTTPYGTTTFNSTDGGTSLEADMTNPLGQTERVEYQENLSTSLVAATESSVPSASGLTIDNSNLNKANTFYWDRREYSDGVAAGGVDSAGFYAKAEVTHWAQSGEGSVPIALSTKRPLEGRVWYNYPGQSNVDYVFTDASGASTSPSVTARVLDGGATQASYASYNANGLVTQSIDPLGRTTNYTYDSNGIDLYQVTQTNGSHQDLLETLSNYNSQHEPQTMVDAAGQTTTMTYNSAGQLTSRTVTVSGSNQTTTLSYTGPSGSGAGNYLTLVTGPISGATTSYTYDNAERIQTVTDSEGYTLTYGYDNLDRPTSVTYPDSTTDLTYYRNLDVDHTVDRQGRVTQNQYDLIRELLQTTDPLGRTTKYTWCLCGGLSTLTDANGHVTTWGLDTQGRVTSKTYADSTGISYVYESNESRLHTMTDARGSVATYAYNVDNTLSGTTYAPGSGVASTPNVSFGYDSVYNRVTSMSDGTGTTTYSYNPINAALGAGRLASVSVPIGGSSAAVTYTYDELGRVVTRGVDAATTDANNVSTTFDALSRVTGVSNALGAFTYAYVDETSRLSGVTYPSGTGLTTSYSYFGNTSSDSNPADDDQRLEEIKNMKGSTPLSKFDYTYNHVGTIATWTQQADSSTAIVNTLSYDAADQLTSAVQSGGGSASNAYDYDPAGNRLTETTATGTTTGNFNAVNQLMSLTSTGTHQTVSGSTSAAVTSVTVNAVPATISNGTNFTASVPLTPGSTNMISVVAQPSSSTGTTTTQRWSVTTGGTAPATQLAYDANGNVTSDENGNTYTWDALNRLTKITYPSTAYTTFAYDGLSRRTQIAEYNSSHSLTSTKNYLWIGSEIAEERNSSNAVQKRFFPQGEQQAGSNYYYTRDHLGSVRETCNSSGTIVARYSYDPYGRTTLVSGSNLATKQYAGMYAHQTSGLYLTMYRAFDPNTGRWLNRDPIAEKGGIDLYEYCGDNPIYQTDASGLAPRGAKPLSPPDTSACDAYNPFLNSKCSQDDGTEVTDPYPAQAKAICRDFFKRNNTCGTLAAAKCLSSGEAMVEASTKSCRERNALRLLLHIKCYAQGAYVPLNPPPGAIRVGVTELLPDTLVTIIIYIDPGS